MARRGRQIDENLLERMIKELSDKPTTVADLAVRVDTSKRTAYRYVELLVDQGVPIVKLGMAKDAPYYVMKNRGKKRL